MENFKDSIRRRIRFGSLYCSMVLLVIGAMNIFEIEETHGLDFVMGMLIGLEFLAIFFIFRYAFALKDEKKLKEMYIKENDEREKVLRQKSGGTIILILLATLIIALGISVFFNIIVFYTLYAVLMFMALTAVVVKLIYKKIG